MIIRFESLKDGSNHWIENINPRDLELDTELFQEPVAVELDVEKRTGKIPLSIVTRAVGTFMCGRCSEDFRLNIAGTCSVLFMQRETPLPDELPGDDLRSYRPGQNEIDITVDVRDALLLALPIRLLCSDNCQGLCPVCGENLNLGACRCVK
jgi:uncharacterized protein